LTISAQKAAEEPTEGHAVEDQPAELGPGEEDPEQEREEHPEQRSLAEADERRATGRHAAGHLLHEAQPLPTIATRSTAKPWSDSQSTARSAAA
jgi:hypothetical protein